MKEPIAITSGQEGATEILAINANGDRAILILKAREVSTGILHDLKDLGFVVTSIGDQFSAMQTEKFKGSRNNLMNVLDSFLTMPNGTITIHPQHRSSFRGKGVNEVRSAA